MISIVAVLSLAFAAAWSTEDVNLPDAITKILGTKGEQYKLYEKHTEAIKLPSHADEDTLKGLDIKRDKSVTEEDLDLYYWHGDVKFAVDRFITLIDNNGDRKIVAADLEDDFKLKQYKVALSECKFLKSPGLRQSCYADQLLTYVLLAVGKEDKKQFFDFLSGGQQSIPLSKIESLPVKDNFDIGQTAEELGASGDGQVTSDELYDYISQESILDDFRRCRTINKDNNPDFKDDCLLEELLEYTNDDLTDLDIAVLFRWLDKDEDDVITEQELKSLPKVNTKANHRDILDLLDRDGPDDQSVNFAEFRAYLRSPTVLIQMERECTEKKETQEDEIKCIFKLFTNLALDLHYPIWLEVPDLDQEITFEIFDFNNDGELKKDELSKEFFKGKDPLAVTRFIEEIDSNDSGSDVDLEEFNEYLDIPHMVYGTADCLLKSRVNKEERGSCFTDETEDIIDNIKYLPKSAFQSWFEHFINKDSVNNDNKRIDIETIANVDTKVKEIFLEELGQGGDIVTEFEFIWYAKQQELADRYEDKELAGIESLENGESIKEDLPKLTESLVKYINDDFTELDTVLLFKLLDKDDNGELTVDDFDSKITEQMETLLASIDMTLADGDEDKTVNFLEFWLWLNAPASQQDKTKLKDVWEKDCQEKHDTQAKELKCLVEKFHAKAAATAAA